MNDAFIRLKNYDYKANQESFCVDWHYTRYIIACIKQLLARNHFNFDSSFIIKVQIKMKIAGLVFLNVGLIVATPTKYDERSKTNCGYQSCTPSDPNKLNVHIVPHSHDDVGWLKTVDQYYWGVNSFVQRAGVQYIIDSVLTALDQNPERRFVQVETAFFYQWWEKQDENRRALFKKLVDEGRLEILNGAWSMNDEATTHYQSIIDQFTLGLRVINDTLGECGRPKIGWQIDTFGHSREMASIYSKMGFDGLFFARLDWRDKYARLNTKTGEMLWQGDPNLGHKSNLFTSVLYNHYSAPPGYCFDILCEENPIIDDIKNSEYNYKEKVEGFAFFIHEQAYYYATNNIIITMGDDFSYQDALSYYKNLDKIVKGFKIFPQYYREKPINVFYSTPSCYVKAVNEASERNGLPFPVKRDDFFPYANSFDTYWTGYFTSRPNSKRFERQGNNILQVTKQLNSFVPRGENDDFASRSLQEAMGIMQHHDAITGTEKQHVADDYHKILTQAITDSVQEANRILSSLLSAGGAPEAINFKFETCLLANVSICPISQSREFIAAVYNPLSKPVTHYVRLPIESFAVQVEGPNGESVKCQVLPAMDNFEHLSQFNPARLELVFLAENIPPLGAKLFKILADKDTKFVPKGRNIFKIGDNKYGVELDPNTGLLQKIILNGTQLDVKQKLMYYNNTASGAYIFKPSRYLANPITSFSKSLKTEVYRGDLVEEIHQTFSPWTKQILRLYRNTSYVEFDWLVGPINISNYQAKEVISRFTTPLDTYDVFYTDSNGRQMVKRRRNHRETYKYTNEHPIAANYYPVTTKILLKDPQRNLEFAVLTDRAQGGSSLSSGEVELMLHRRLVRDDGLGVGEGLNEIEYGDGIIARGQHYVTFGPSSVDGGKTSAAVQRDIAQKKLLAPWIFLTRNTNSWKRIKKEFSGVSTALPESIQILTLEPWKKDTLLLRLEHVFEVNDDPILSKPVSINLNELFSYFDIMCIEEMTLDGTQTLTENERMQWIIGDDLTNFNMLHSSKKYTESKHPNVNINNVTLNAMEIRTFLLHINYKN